MKSPVIMISPPVFNTEDIGYEDISDGFSNTKTSYLSLKSSVLSPSSTRLTNQYLALEQLRAHYEMIARAKARVDTSLPKSVHSSLGRIGQRRREIWKSRSSISLCSINGLSRTPSPETFNNLYMESLPKETRHHQKSEETGIITDDDITIGDKVSWYLKTVPTFKDKHTHSSRNKQNPTDFSGKSRMNNQQQNISVADKISWYLEAVQQGAFTSDQISSVNGYSSDNLSSSSNEIIHQNSIHRKHYLKTNNDHAAAQKINNSTYTLRKYTVPRICSKNETKSKLLNMKCYHPVTQRRKYRIKKKAVHPEPKNIYDDSSNSDDEKIYRESRVDNFQQVPEKLKRPVTEMDHQRSHNLYSSPIRRYRSSLDLLSRSEAKYLAFIQSVTEDILNNGIYTDRAIKKALEFHVRRQNDLDSNIVKQLMDQFLDDLCVSKEETSISNALDTPVDLTGRSTPPERDCVKFSNNDNGTEIDHVFPISVTVTTAHTKSSIENKDTSIEEFGSNSLNTEEFIPNGAEVPDKDCNIFDD